MVDPRKLGVVTLGAMKQYSRIEKFLMFLRSWYLCYFTPDAARQMQSAAPAQYLDRTGSNLNNVAQYMYRDNPKTFKRVLDEIRTKIPNIEKIEPVKMRNGQMVLQFWKKGFTEPFFSQRMSDVGVSGGCDLSRRQGADEKGLPDLCGARQVQARVGGEHRAAHVPGCKCIAEFSIFFERDPKADFAGERVSV